MKKLLLTIIILIFSGFVYAGSLADEAKSKGINEVCQTHLEEIDSVYNLNGLNLTFYSDNEPSLHPSLHTSTKKYKDGASFFSASLSPDGDKCYISIINTAVSSNKTCSIIVDARLQKTPSLKVISYSDYLFVYSESNSDQSLFVDIGKEACAITDIRMM